jgi:hypothetical protein
VTDEEQTLSEGAQKIKERVENLVTTNFSITKCPVKIWEEFVTFCKEETNNNYSFGLKLLLGAYKANIKEIMLYEQYILMKERMELLEKKLDEVTPKKEKKQGPKTMGSKVEKTDEEETK